MTGALGSAAPQALQNFQLSAHGSPHSTQKEKLLLAAVMDLAPVVDLAGVDLAGVDLAGLDKLDRLGPAELRITCDSDNDGVLDAAGTPSDGSVGTNRLTVARLLPLLLLSI